MIFSPTAKRTCASFRSLPGVRGSKRSSRGLAIHASISRRSFPSPHGRILAAARNDPAAAGAGIDADAVEGIMLKRRDALYVPGRPKGPVVEVEARSVHRRCRAHVCATRSRQALVVLFGLHVRVWTRGQDGDELVPVGKAYFGFTGTPRITADRSLRAPQHHRPLRAGSRGRASTEPGTCARGRVRRFAAFDPAQVGARHALPGASIVCAGTSRLTRPTGWERLEAMPEARLNASPPLEGPCCSRAALVHFVKRPARAGCDIE